MRTPQISVTLGRQPRPRKNDTTDSTEIDWDAIGVKAAVIQQSTETVVKVAVAAYLAKKLIDTTCQIAVIVAEAKLK